MESLFLSHMESLSIEGNKYCPQIEFDGDSGSLQITGASFMEHPVEFYDPVISWLNQFSRTSHSKSTLKIYLSYFNSGSSGAIFDIFQLLEEKAASCPVAVEWHVGPDDEEMFAEGKEFQDYFDKLEFNIVQN